LPALSSDQARANAATPAMSELDLERLLMAIAANDRTNGELAAEFNRAPSTIYNIKVKHRDRIEDLRRKMSVGFEDLFMVRKQARLDDIQELRNLAWDQLRALLASNTVINGRIGEVRSGSVDERKFKVFAELILKCNRNFAEETGQLPQRVDGLDSRYTAPVLGISGSFDYTRFAQVEAQRKAEWEAAAPEREAAKREREAASDALMRSIRARVEEAQQIAVEQAHERVLAQHPEWAAAYDDDGDESFDDLVEADDGRESGESNVQEPVRMMPSRPEPVEEPVEVAPLAQVEEPANVVELRKVPAVNEELVAAAKGLAGMVWWSGERPLSRFYEKGRRDDVDDYLGYAMAQGWVRVDDRDGQQWVVKGPKRPASVGGVFRDSELSNPLTHCIHRPLIWLVARVNAVVSCFIEK